MSMGGRVAPLAGMRILGFPWRRVVSQSGNLPTARTLNLNSVGAMMGMSSPTFGVVGVDCDVIERSKAASESAVRISDPGELGDPPIAVISSGLYLTSVPFSRNCDFR